MATGQFALFNGVDYMVDDAAPLGSLEDVENGTSRLQVQAGVDPAASEAVYNARAAYCVAPCFHEYFW